MVANTQLSLSARARRMILVALACLGCAAAMLLSASGASARTRMCPHADARIANVTHNGVEHAAVCFAGHARVSRHLPVLLPSRKI